MGVLGQKGWETLSLEVQIYQFNSVGNWCFGSKRLETLSLEVQIYQFNSVGNWYTKVKFRKYAGACEMKIKISAILCCVPGWGNVGNVFDCLSLLKNKLISQVCGHCVTEEFLCVEGLGFYHRPCFMSWKSAPIAFIPLCSYITVDFIEWILDIFWCGYTVTIVFGYWTYLNDRR